LIGGGVVAGAALPRLAVILWGALWAVTVAGSFAGAMLPFALRARNARQRAPLPLVSVLVDALGVLVYCLVALAMLRAGAR
jgi:hypothetical protein